MAVAFDTLKAATRLREEAGFDERQARVLVATFAEGIGESLATKEDLGNTETALRKDLENIETALRNEIRALRTDLENTKAALRTDMANAEATLRKDLENTATALQGQMRELEQRMTVRLGAMIAAAMGIAVALIKLLP